MDEEIGKGISGAYFSPDRKYRYALWRIWDRGKPALVFIGFNPSKADEIHDDPTVLKLIAYAKGWGYGRLYIGNLFALCSPSPAEILHRHDAIGPENDHILATLKKLGDMVLVGWGNNASYSERYKSVLDLLGSRVYCLSVTKQSQPAHPLYLSPWNEPKEYLPASAEMQDG